MANCCSTPKMLSTKATEQPVPLTPMKGMENQNTYIFEVCESSVAHSKNQIIQKYLSTAPHKLFITNNVHKCFRYGEQPSIQFYGDVRAEEENSQQRDKGIIIHFNSLPTHSDQCVR